jgi:IS30 family transposase
MQGKLEFMRIALLTMDRGYQFANVENVLMADELKILIHPSTNQPFNQLTGDR